MSKVTIGSLIDQFGSSTVATLLVDRTIYSAYSNAKYLVTQTWVSPHGDLRFREASRSYMLSVFTGDFVEIDVLDLMALSA